MTVSPFAPAKPRTAAPRKRAAGGDDQVERDGNGRPRILTECEHCGGTGKIPSEKRPGNLNKCLKCAGEGKKKIAYTRVTTFIDVLEDKKNLEAWSNRMVLVGAAMDPGFLRGVLPFDPESTEQRDALNRQAAAAKELAGASDKADKGSFLHELSEMADRHEELPHDISPDDWLDIKSYVDVTHPLLKIAHMERLVVNDAIRAAGTPDRVSTVLETIELRAPDGYLFGPGELIITDLKTGRVDYGALKIAMQLAIYANSEHYDPETGERIPLGDVNQKWGIIMHTPAGKGTTTLYWADLELGWQAVQVAKEVRSLRNRGKRALSAFAGTGLLYDLAAEAA